MTWRHLMFAVASPGDAHAGAIDKVSRLARALDAEIELFHCVYDADIARPGRFGSRGIERDIREIVEARHRQLETTARRLRADGLNVRTSVRWDYPPYEGIIRQALRHKPDLLIAQSTRRGRLARLMLTQTDYRLIEACPCPLLLIKSARPYAQGSILAAVDPTHARDKPAALDKEILDAGAALSQALGLPMDVYHACEPWPNVVKESAELRSVPELLQPDVHARYRERSEARVRELAERQSVPRGRIHVEEGDAAESLRRFAESLAADIVVMGAVSRSGLKRAFLGHTAERVLDALDADALIVKAPAFRSPVRRQSIHRLPKGHAPSGRYIW